MGGEFDRVVGFRLKLMVVLVVVGLDVDAAVRHHREFPDRGTCVDIE